MTCRFCLYYFSSESGAYLQKIIDSCPQGLLVGSESLANLPAQQNSGADVIFLEYQEDHPDLDRWIEKITADPHSPAIFLFLRSITTDGLLQALRLGVKECFTFPIGEEELARALHRVLRRTMPGVEPTPVTRVISFLGCKGGVGTTFLAANTAFLLAQESQRQVLLMDLDLHYGQLIHFLDIQPPHTIIDVIDHVDQMDDAYFKSLTHACDQYLHLLPAPTRLEDAETVTPERLEKLLRYLKGRSLFHPVLVDAGSQISEVTLKALELSDQLVLVATPSIPALSNVRKLLDLLPLVGLGGLTLHLWLNVWPKDGDLTQTEVARFLGREVDGTIRCELRDVGHSINEGRLLAEMAAGHPLCRDLRLLAAGLIGKSPEPKAISGWRRLINLWRKS